MGLNSVFWHSLSLRSNIVVGRWKCERSVEGQGMGVCSLHAPVFSTSWFSIAVTEAPWTSALWSREVNLELTNSLGVWRHATNISSVHVRTTWQMMSKRQKQLLIKQTNKSKVKHSVSIRPEAREWVGGQAPSFITGTLRNVFVWWGFQWCKGFPPLPHTF